MILVVKTAAPCGLFRGGGGVADSITAINFGTTLFAVQSADVRNIFIQGGWVSQLLLKL